MDLVLKRMYLFFLFVKLLISIITNNRWRTLIIIIKNAIAINFGVSCIVITIIIKLNWLLSDGCHMAWTFHKLTWVVLLVYLRGDDIAVAEPSMLLCTFLLLRRHDVSIPWCRLDDIAAGCVHSTMTMMELVHYDGYWLW